MGKKKYKNQEVGRVSKVPAVALTVIWIVWVALMYYLLLPAINIHSVGLWLFVILICALPAGIFFILHRMIVGGTKQMDTFGKGAGISFTVVGVGLLMLLLLGVFGSKMFHAAAYASVLETKEYNFTEDLDQATAISKIALMDTDSAILLGNREIGSLSEVVSQYNVSEDYSQIDLLGSPVKVSALDYAGFFKYMGNKANGVPGYVKVDPVGQSAEYVAMDQGMNYVPSAYFSKDLKRHLRAQYPTKIFYNIHFEIDEEGNPYYIASVADYTIGVFGGETVQGAIVCNPVDGSSTYYPVSEIPSWVDDVFDGDLLVEQYDWYGELSNGFLNSIFGKKGCKKCTETIDTDSSDDDDDDASYTPDYGYVAKDGDIWIYTGVTSVNDDASNIGFILVNERTSEAHYYTVAGADESSAMSAAEGEVQEKRYRASFPSLINVDEQPTYVMVLKDASGIVKLYAMVNVESYNKVTTAATLDECFAKYRKLIGSNVSEETDASDTEADEKTDTDTEEDTETREFTVTGIKYVDIDGNTYVYLTGDDDALYKMKFSDDENLIYVKKDDHLQTECVQGSGKAYRMQSFEVKND